MLYPANKGEAMDDCLGSSEFDDADIYGGYYLETGLTRQGLGRGTAKEWHVFSSF